MNHTISPLLARILVLSVACLAVWSGSASAYQQYSQNRDATNCRACHGDFRAADYFSVKDNGYWGNLHSLHRMTMLSGDCDVCHQISTFPVQLSVSNGGTGLAPIGCVGCHGRDADNTAANPEYPDGRGAGLRQHHQRAGVTVCGTCHADADPSTFTTAGEDVLPPYYGVSIAAHPKMPTQSCNGDGSENFAGYPRGLDNDGDLAYDGADANCSTVDVGDAPVAQAVRLQNYPNPFNPVTIVRYELPVTGWVRVRVYDASGRLVRTLVSSDHVAAGVHETRWDGLADSGLPAASGIYLCELKTAGSATSIRLALLR